MRRPIIFLFFALFVLSCDEVIELDISQTRPMVVIEGFFTNRADNNYVKITHTTSFYDTARPPALRNAVVSITGTDGLTLNFLPYAGTDPDSMAFYLPEFPLTGQINEIYTLNVSLNGENYLARDTLNYVSPIDSLKSMIDPFEQANPEEPGRYYQVLMYTKEPQETKDYYLFRFYRNQVQERAFENDIYVADDIFLADYFNGVRTPVHYFQNDTSVVEMYRISRQTYIYYFDLQNVINNDGGMFSPPPSNPRNNLGGEVLGHFTVAAVESDTVIVQ